MNDDVKKDLLDSIHDTEKILFPALKVEKCFEGELIQIQRASLSNSEGLIARFDQLAGIDIWNIKTNKGMVGIANRIQWVMKPYNTFTIRRTRDTGTETEYSKILRALSEEDLVPKYIIHAYISERRIGRLLSFAIAKTKDIFQMIIDRNCKIQQNFIGDENTFYIISWTNMQYHGYDIKIYDYTKRKEKTGLQLEKLFRREFTEDDFNAILEMNADYVATYDQKILRCFMCRNALQKKFKDLTEGDKYHLIVCLLNKPDSFDSF